VLFPMEGKDADGYVLFQKDRTTQLLPVRRYRFEPGTQVPSRRFQSIAQLLSIGATKTSSVDYARLKPNFRVLAERGFGNTRLTDAVSAEALLDAKLWSRRWLPPLFNTEIEGTRVVLWWPEQAKQFGPALYCRDRETAICTSLLFSGVKLCPGCGVPFVPVGKQQFHNINCAARSRMQAKRERDKNRKKKGKRDATN
jgi:hypothetical protein